MATVRNLAVEITANASKLRSEVASSQRTIQNFSRTAVQRLGSVAKVLTGLGVAAAGAFTAFGVMGVRKINQVAAEIDELAKAAGNIRFEVSELQELRFIADQTGTSIGELERGVQFMNRTIAQGSDKTADALRGIGFSIDQVMSMSPAERFRAITTAIGEMGSEVDQTRILYELFGRSGANMLNLVSADQEKLAQVVKDSGVLLTQEQARAVEAYQDAKGRLGMLWDGFQMQFTSNMAGPLRSIVEWIEKFALGMGGMDQLANKAAIGVLQFVRSGVVGIQSLLNKIGEMELFWMRVQLAVLATGEAIAKVGNMLTPSVWAQKLGVNFADTDLQRVEQNLSGAAGMVADQMGVRSAELSGRGGFTDPALSALDSMINELIEAGEASKQLKESTDSASQTMDKWDRMVEQASQQNDQAGVKVDLNLTTDRGQLKGEIIASPELARAMQTIAAREINNTARGVAA